MGSASSSSAAAATHTALDASNQRLHFAVVQMLFARDQHRQSPDSTAALDQYRDAVDTVHRVRDAIQENTRAKLSECDSINAAIAEIDNLLQSGTQHPLITQWLAQTRANLIAERANTEVKRVRGNKSRLGESHTEILRRVSEDQATDYTVDAIEREFTDLDGILARQRMRALTRARVGVRRFRPRATRSRSRATRSRARYPRSPRFFSVFVE